MLCLIVHAEGARPRYYPLPNEQASIGRSEDNDVVLPSTRVSAQHATLARTVEGFVLRDDGSKNGIVVAGGRVSSVLLTPGTDAWLGDVRLTIQEGETAEVRTAITIRGAVAGEAAETDAGVRPNADTALRVVARILQGRLGDAQDPLAEARALLGATAVQHIEIRNGEVSIVSISGEPVAREVVQRVATAGPSPRRIERIGSTSIIASATKRRGVRSAIFATFDGKPREFQQWEKDFFECLTALLLKERSGHEPIHAAVAEAGMPPFVCESTIMRTLVDRATRHPAARDAILLIGETGTGKELMARMLHKRGPFAKGEFVAVNCANLPETMIDSLLMGIEKGVATEILPREGYFAAADNGTIFLDEIGELSTAMQGKLLRVLQERSVTPLGSTKARPVNLRIIAATDREERLRDQLRYRFQFRFRIPPLRERQDDIVPMAMHFIETSCRERGIARLALSENALRRLRQHPWPGNVRELQDVVGRAVAAAAGSGPLHAAHFEFDAPEDPLPPRRRTRKEEEDSANRAMILASLERNRGNKSAVARELDVSREWLRQTMHRLAITANRR